MHLRAAVINDLSGLGRCSLTADIAVLAAMGIEACPLPTAVLTAQTGYEGYHSVSLASHMEAYRRHWNALGITFAGILSGYLASPEAAYQTAEFVDTFHHPGVTYLCDPVLGDQGRVYKGFTDASIEAMRSLAEKADFLTPNLTEFCLLTGTEMDAIMNREKEDKDALFAILTQKAAAFSQTDLVITGIPLKGEKSGKEICNLIISQGSSHPVIFPHLGGSYSGTGDLFAAVLLAARLHKEGLVPSVNKAGQFIAKGITAAQKEHTPGNAGIDYEPFLPLLRSSKEDGHDSAHA